MQIFIDQARMLARRQWLFVAIVLVPTLISAPYFGMVASDVWLVAAVGLVNVVDCGHARRAPRLPQVRQLVRARRDEEP